MVMNGSVSINFEKGTESLYSLLMLFLLCSKLGQIKTKIFSSKKRVGHTIVRAKYDFIQILMPYLLLKSLNKKSYNWSRNNLFLIVNTIKNSFMKNTYKFYLLALVGSLFFNCHVLIAL